MKRAIVTLLLFTFIGISCSVQENNSIADCLPPACDVFYGVTEEGGESETKVYVDDHFRTLWHAEDCISIFNRNTVNSKYQFNGQTGDNSGSFTYVQDEGTVTGGSLNHVYAVYPYSEKYSIVSNGYISFDFPDKQYYEAGSFDRNANFMLAASDDNALKFKNLCGVLQLKLYGTGQVSSIVLSGNNQETLAGPAKMSIGSASAPSLSFSAGNTSSSLELICSEPEALYSNSSYPLKVFIVVPPMVFKKGLTITVSDPDGRIFEQSTSNQIEIKRSSISTMATVEVVFDEPAPTIESITSVPTFEYKGKKSFRYDYLYGATGQFSGYDETSGPNNEYWVIRSKSNFVYSQTKFYAIGSYATARFNVLPETAPVEDFEWAFSDLGTSGVSPDVVSAQRQSGSLMDVLYRISNFNKYDPDKDLTCLYTNSGSGTIESDAFSIVPLEWRPKSLAYSRRYNGNICRGLDCAINGYNELYTSAVEAARSEYGVEALYDGGGIALDFINVHMYGPDITEACTVSTNEVAVSLQELQALYPQMDFDIQYEIIDAYNNGESTKAYGMIEGGMFYPAYPAPNGTPIMINENNLVNGRAAIGKSVIVAAKLVYRSETICAGYFKVFITREPVIPVTTSFEAADMGVYPNNGYTIANTVRVSNFYSALESACNLTYQAFRNMFTTSDDTYYIKSGSFIKSTQYGKVDFVKDNSNNIDNDLFSVTLTSTQVQNIGSGKSVTLYKLFHGYILDGDYMVGEQYVYIGFKVTAGQKPVPSFSEKIQPYWYKDVQSYYGLRANVPLPNSTYDDVTNYVINIDDYWIGGKVNVKVDGKVDNNVHYKYRFARTQPRAGSANKQFAVSSDMLTLKWNNVDVIKIIEPSTGLIRFLCNDTAKELLSWASNMYDDNPGQNILYSLVELVAYYPVNGVSEFELGSETISVRFLRPITFSISAAGHLNESTPGGSMLEIGQFFSAKDWLNNNVFCYDKVYGQYVDGVYYNNGEPIVNWRQYYGVWKMTVDLNSVTTNLAGSYRRLSDVNPSAKIVIVDGGSNTYTGRVNIGLDPISNLSGMRIKYTSTNGLSSDYILRVPVAIEHAWGTWTVDLDIPVYGTAHQ